MGNHVEQAAAVENITNDNNDYRAREDETSWRGKKNMMILRTCL